VQEDSGGWDMIRTIEIMQLNTEDGDWMKLEAFIVN
jgi:hypothetical protein